MTPTNANQTPASTTAETRMSDDQMAQACVDAFKPIAQAASSGLAEFQRRRASVAAAERMREELRGLLTVNVSPAPWIAIRGGRGEMHGIDDANSRHVADINRAADADLLVWLRNNAEAIAAALASSRGGEGQPPQACWFIERGQGEWWTPSVRMGWSRDPHKAVRFCRREDADAVILGRDITDSVWRDCNPFASEHVFMDAAASPGAGDAEGTT